MTRIRLHASLIQVYLSSKTFSVMLPTIYTAQRIFKSQVTSWRRVFVGNWNTLQLLQKFPTFCERENIFHFHNNWQIPPPPPISSHISPVKVFPFYFFKIKCNIIFPSTLKTSNWSLSFSLLHQDLVSIAFLSLMCHAPNLADPHYLTAKIKKILKINVWRWRF